MIIEERKQYIEFITKDLKALNYNQNFIGIIKETFDLYQELEKINKRLISDNETLRKEINNDYILKKTIKEKINERKNNISYLSKFSDWQNKEYTNEDITNYCIETLEELLKE